MYDNNLKEAREELGMTQKELGFVFGVSKYTVSGWENVNDPMPLNKLIKFCNMYDYSLDYIVGFDRKNSHYNKTQYDKVKIGLRLKELRKSLKLSQQQLSEECKISQTTYSGYETGTYLISTMNLYAICKKYNVSMDYVVGRNENKLRK